MFYTISFYIALTIFAIGFLYKIATWFMRTTVPGSREISTARRVSSALTGIVGTIFSAKIGTLIKVLVLDGIFQRKVFIENRLRWLAHILIYGGFMLLLLMHAMDALITSALFDEYASTLNPFLFLRDIFGLLVIIGVVLALYRRFILKAPRLTTTPMDSYALILVAVIMVSGILLEGVKIGSYTSYRQMVADYAGLEEGEDEYKALTAFWVTEFGTVAPDLKAPFDTEVMDTGRELHESNCMGCHSKPQWAVTGYPVARLLKGVAGGLDRAHAPTILWVIHLLACFIGLAYLPFSKFFHIITSPLSLLANSVMDAHSSPANIATRQAMEFDACMHCGNCTNRCSVGIIFEQIPNAAILPSEKLPALKAVAGGKELAATELTSLMEGAYLCTNCHRCTDVCPAGINLQELWFSMREQLFEKEIPLFSALSPLSYYRGLQRERIAPDDYDKPLHTAREAIAERCQLMKDRDAPVKLEGSQGLGLSDHAASFAACFGCQTCTNVCPVVANYDNPAEVLGLLPHQIMYATGLGVKDLALGSNMLWDCLTCYQCQEQCPQGVKVTEVLYELKNLAINATTQKG